MLFFQYHSFGEALSILRQVTLSLAIAEEVSMQFTSIVTTLGGLYKILCCTQAVQFEHRDMHRGNVLVKRTKEEFIYFRLNHKDYYIKSYGVRATIVDFTLSRVTQAGNDIHSDPMWAVIIVCHSESDCLSHQDLNNLPWLFKGKGDIQFDVYRNMRNATQ